ncbi:pimeloyl-ACP methyl ester carboxylesterase [Herbihabitans rhizosphaerae]|uniref:Pimeloyl-ACP methyl ester carboxylesterase n=1 Tax=Herbihabitans rhizosphaerae TaxID=1872711 RepID=A0A4Q7KDH4_9PSEU|nr:alpha/beta hydrolase [Herbihabitans rhizosphaerae]RZS32255.1 pimeloyl-ACP methyl ester carboxylesterase [Herbihabitans rhizosphaerae]
MADQKTRRRARAWLAVGVVLGIGVTTAGAIGASAESTPNAVPSIDWTPCGDAIECATVQAPLDYTRPFGETVSLKVTRRKATDPARRIGTLFVNPGGPGGSASGLVNAVAKRDTTGETGARFDIIGMDPRGVGGSTPTIRCVATNDYAAQWAEATAVAADGQFKRAVSQARSYDKACADNTGRLLPHLGTANVARDMDLVRAALGEEKISYLGLSYGTYIGTVYANMFPHRVRAAMLDGGYDPRRYASDPYPNDMVQYHAVEKSLNRFLDWCASDAAKCGFGAGRPAEAFRALQADLDANPLRDPSGGVIANGATTTFAVVSYVNRGTSGWVPLGAALAKAQARDGSSDLLAPIGDGDTNFYAANVAVECNDRVFPGSLADAEGTLAEEAKAGPLLGNTIAYGPPNYDHGHALACLQWPAERKSRYDGRYDARTETPILVVGTTHDPDTPYQDSVALSKSLGNARLLTFDGDGHTGFGRSKCALSAEFTYLLELKLPDVEVCKDNPPPA